MNELMRTYLENKATEARRWVITELGEIGVGHIGGSMSIIETLIALYYSEMNIDPGKPDWDERDRLVVSKGHAGPAVYAVLAMKGYFGLSELYTLNQPGTNLPSHCDMRKTIGIDMSTGSLGQGISAAVGMALASKLDRLSCYIYTIIGDGESQEGQIWEAAMVAGSRKLDNLIAFTDFNKIQLDDYVENINTLEPLSAKWEAFGWHVQSIDGHDVSEIVAAIRGAKDHLGKPSMIILNTVKGKGFTFSEGNVRSHNMVVTKELMNKALQEIADAKQGA